MDGIEEIYPLPTPKRLLTDSVSVDFSVLLSRFSILFVGLYQHAVYYPTKKNRKSAKIIQKLDET